MLAPSLLRQFVNTVTRHTLKTELLATLLSEQADEFRLFTSLFPLIPFRSFQKGSQGYPQEKNPEDFVSDMTAKADGLTEERAELLKFASVGGFFQEGTCGTGCTPDFLS